MLRGTRILRQRLRVTCAASAFTESHIIRGMVWLSSYNKGKAIPFRTEFRKSLKYIQL